MNILLLESDLRHTGGSEAMAFAVAKGLSERRHSIFLVFKDEGPLLAEHGAIFREMEKVNLQCFAWRFLGPSLTTVRTLWKLTRRWEIDAIFTSHLGFLRNLALLRSISGTPFVYHLGLGLLQPTPSHLWAIRKMSAGVAPSPITAKMWQESGLPREKLHVVSNWIDSNRFNPGAGKLPNRRKVGLDERGPLIVFVGRIVPEKGGEMLLRAFSRILVRQPEATLAFVGRIADTYAAELAALCAELKLSNERVRMIGFSKEPELYFAAADIAVVPSIWDEPFGLTAIEGMACGAVTLVSSAGALPTVVGDENQDLVFPFGNVNALARMLEDWLSHPRKIAERGLKLRDYALKNFQASDKIERYEAILRTAR